MQLPDEAISYNYQSLLIPPAEEWTAAAELRGKHFLNPQFWTLGEPSGRLLWNQ